MSLGDSLQKLNDFDINDLDFENVGSWPAVVKIIACVLVFVAVIGIGYPLYLSDMQGTLDQVVRKERQLREEFQTKAFQAANVESYKQQMVEMETSFGALLRQLPSDTEVPGLLEDITYLGVGSGLEFNFINLQPEVVNAFYIELPISISVKGGYHDIGSFVSGVANLPRIVTLHDFKLTPGNSGGVLTMQILAKTYRYNDKGAQ
ncbi:type 4a pilus biogenesis protein PilO [Kistimonas asteriae]|uniref:type 4a pilus biogenesis protein PilO n=1 Tax=Kistimonas asteriae TaxID=517724 RepID=UPI001BAD6A73|nr:type 4a pilus biogenesis protein PilO [Kistimonas asteriae]